MRRLAVLVLAPLLALAAPLPPASAAQETAPAVTGDTLRLTLDDAIQIALARGAEMRAADAGVDVARGQIREAEGDALPQLTGAIEYTHTFASVFSGAAASGDTIFGPMLRNTPFAAENLWSLDLTASQVVFSRRIGSALAAAHAYRAGNEAQRAQTVDDVKLAVERAYYTAAAAGELRRIAVTGLDQARAHLAQVELFRREGTRAEYDLIEAQVDARNAEPPVVTAANERELALLELARLLGIEVPRPILLTTPVRFDGDLLPVADTEVAPAERAALAAAEAEIRGRRSLVDVERAARWPELKVSGTLSQQAFPEQNHLPQLDQYRHNIQATARLDFPLFLGFKTEGAIQRAAAELEQAKVRRDALRQSIELERAHARRDLDRTLAVLLARRGTVSLARRAHQLATVRYANGLSTQLEVSDARLQMLTAEGNEVVAARDYRIALAVLEHALGTAVPVELRPIDEISLNPDIRPATAAPLGAEVPSAAARGAR